MPVQIVPPVDMKPVFSFEYADRHFADAGWSWPAGDEAGSVLGFLCDTAKRTWKEIRGDQTGRRDRHRKHHEMQFDSVCTAAQERIRTLRLDETFDEFFRFCLGGKPRLWGFVRDHVFYVLWWDAEHQVCPTDPE